MADQMFDEQINYNCSSILKSTIQKDTPGSKIAPWLEKYISSIASLQAKYPFKCNWGKETYPESHADGGIRTWDLLLLGSSTTYMTYMKWL
jgi:hypothetical protein